MTATIYNSKNIKYIWNTSDDDCLTSMTFLCEDNIIYAITCTYDDDTTEMKYTYYKSTDTDNNKELWNQLMLDDLENFDKCFNEVTDKEDIAYIEHIKIPICVLITEMRHILSHDTLYSMIVALYTSITNETSVPKNILHKIHSNVISMLRGNQLQSQEENSFWTPLMSYSENEYKELVSNIIELIKNNYVQS